MICFLIWKRFPSSIRWLANLKKITPWSLCHAMTQSYLIFLSNIYALTFNNRLLLFALDRFRIYLEHTFSVEWYILYYFTFDLIAYMRIRWGIQESAEIRLGKINVSMKIKIWYMNKFYILSRYSYSYQISNILIVVLFRWKKHENCAIHKTDDSSSDSAICFTSL